VRKWSELDHVVLEAAAAQPGASLERRCIRTLPLESGKKRPRRVVLAFLIERDPDYASRPG